MRSKQRKRLVLVAAGLGLFLAGLAGGYAVGSVRMFGWMRTQLSSETQGNLSRRVERLARLRIGDEMGAIANLEGAVDIAIETLAEEREWQELPGDVQRALMVGQAYRRAYPPIDPSPELSRILAVVPLPEQEYCSPALQQALGLAGDRVGQE